LERSELTAGVIGGVFGGRDKYPALGFSKPFSRAPELRL
jgi:hypothetical protein